nr:uncharacterized protein LOC104114655 [Nicotiana tomentosiformis]
MISVVESDVASLVTYISPIDPLERALMGDEEESEDEMIEEIEQVFNMSCKYVHGLERFEELDKPVTLTPPKPFIDEAPKLELKPLLVHLCYAYLGNSETLPVIISSNLTNVQEEKLLIVLREHKKAIGWTIADIKGISPSFCLHKIFLEDGHIPSIEKQRRLNSIIKEVLKKEQLGEPSALCALKGGMTVVENEKNELIPTRTVMRWRIVIFPEDQEKTTFTCPYGTFSFKRMPFDPCNAPATFQRCMMAIFTDMVEQFVEVFMDDFSVFGSSYDDCLKNLGIVLLEKDVIFNFDEACLKAFEELKKKFMTGPIIVAPDWSLPCYWAVLGQRKDKIF